MTLFSPDNLSGERGHDGDNDTVGARRREALEGRPGSTRQENPAVRGWNSFPRSRSRGRLCTAAGFGPRAAGADGRDPSADQTPGDGLAQAETEAVCLLLHPAKIFLRCAVLTALSLEIRVSGKRSDFAGLHPFGQIGLFGLLSASRSQFLDRLLASDQVLVTRVAPRQATMRLEDRGKNRLC